MQKELIIAVASIIVIAGIAVSANFISNFNSRTPATSLTTAYFAGNPPVLGTVSAPAYVKGGTTVTITGTVTDPDSMNVNVYCKDSTTVPAGTNISPPPSSSNKNCIAYVDLFETNIFYCGYTVATDNGTHYVHCKAYDPNNNQSAEQDTQYITDSIAPVTSLKYLETSQSGGGDEPPPDFNSTHYLDKLNNARTRLIIKPDSVSNDYNECRWGVSNVSFFSMPSANICLIVGCEELDCVARCDFGNLSEGAYTRYYACRDQAGNYSSTQSVNFVVMFLPVVSINNLAGDTSSPYADTVNDNQTILALNSGNATGCQYKYNSAFSYGTGSPCASPNNGTSSCNLGNLSNGNYTYYFICRTITPAGTVVGDSNTSANINFDVSNYPPTVSINNLAGDTDANYVDENLQDNKTDLVLTVSNATGCKWNDSNVVYSSMANNCPLGSPPTTATCSFGSLIEGSYTKYYACTNGNDSQTYDINFDVNDYSPNVSIDITPSGTNDIHPDTEVTVLISAQALKDKNISSINKANIQGCIINDLGDSGIGTSIATNTREVVCPAIPYLTTPIYRVKDVNAYDSNGIHSAAQEKSFSVFSCSIADYNFSIRKINNLNDTSGAGAIMANNVLEKGKFYRAEIKLVDTGNYDCNILDANWSSINAGELNLIVDFTQPPTCLFSSNGSTWQSDSACSFGPNNYINDVNIHDFGFGSSFWWGFNFKTPSVAGGGSVNTMIGAWSQTNSTPCNYYFNSSTPIIVGYAWHPPSASIVSPLNGSQFLFGSNIDFNALVSDAGNDIVSRKWDSNNDGSFGNDTNVSYSGLSYGNHTITFTATDSLGASDSDSVNISVLKTEGDVFGIEEFKVAPVIPSGRFAVDGEANISAQIWNYSVADANASITLTINDALTNQVNYTYTATQVIGGNYYQFSKDINFAQDLEPPGQAKSYYVKLKVAPAFNEENISNNEAMQTILLTGIKAVATPEIREELIALVLAAVLILLLPKKSREKSIKNK